jgi:hypothetical protein
MPWESTKPFGLAKSFSQCYHTSIELNCGGMRGGYACPAAPLARRSATKRTRTAPAPYVALGASAIFVRNRVITDTSHH